MKYNFSISDIQSFSIPINHVYPNELAAYCLSTKNRKAILVSKGDYSFATKNGKAVLVRKTVYCFSTNSSV